MADNSVSTGTIPKGSYHITNLEASPTMSLAKPFNYFVAVKPEAPRTIDLKLDNVVRVYMDKDVN